MRQRTAGLTVVLMLLLGATAAASAACPPGISDSPARQVVCAAGAAVDVGAIAAELGRRFGLAAAPAAVLARTTLHAVELAKRLQSDRPAPALSELREVENGYVDLLRATAADARVVAELQRFAADWDRVLLREPSPALAAYVARSSDPAGLALKLADPSVDGSYPLALLLSAAAAARPAPAALWLRAADFSSSWPALRLALLERAAASPAAAGRATAASGDDEVAAVAERRLRELLGAGLAREALAVFDGLPPTLRERLLASREKSGRRSAFFPDSDLRLELAVARDLTGDRAGGRALLDRVPRLSEEIPDPRHTGLAEEDAARIVARLLVEGELAAGSHRDPFPILARAVARREMVLPYDTDRVAFAHLAEREGYPAFAAFILRSEPPWEDPSDPQPAALPPEVARAAARLGARLAEEARREMDAQAAARAAVRAGLGPDPAAASVARLLAAPRPQPFREHRLPPGLPLAAPPGGEAIELARTLRLPAGAAVLRIERAGRRAAALIAQAPDGVGSAYAVALSADGGATWSRPFDTSLRRAQPYIVRSASSLPLLADDRLRVEVERVPEGGIPPMSCEGLAPGGTGEPPEPGFYLEVPLAELTRDRDGDGATDLEEELRFTDPDDPDTDGDGLRDGADPLPLVPATPADPASGAMAALLGRAAEHFDLLAGVAGASVQDAPRLPGETVYVSADRPLFTGLTASQRIVVLAPEEVAAARKRLGPLCPIGIPLFAFDPERRHAVAVWSWGGQGGTVWLEEKDGAWTATVTDYWVS